MGHPEFFQFQRKNSCAPLFAGEAPALQSRASFELRERDAPATAGKMPALRIKLQRRLRSSLGWRLEFGNAVGGGLDELVFLAVGEGRGFG
jgi:hypothetical protein